MFSNYTLDKEMDFKVKELDLTKKRQITLVTTLADYVNWCTCQILMAAWQD